MSEIDNKARELKSFFAPAGITDPKEIKRILESQMEHIDSYSLTAEEKALFKAAAEKIIQNL